jgi:hypothetical protein
MSERILENCIEPCDKIDKSSYMKSFIEKFKEKPLLELTIFSREFETSNLSQELLSYTWNVTSVDEAESKFNI